MAEKRPDRVLGPFDATFWEYCTKGEFRLQRCNACGHYAWPPAPLCSECLSEDLTWTLLSGRGKVKTHCTFERQYYPECPPPWPVVVVDLEEGPWFVGNPKGINWSELKIGMSVKVSFIDCEDSQGQFKLPVFERA